MQDDKKVRKTTTVQNEEKRGYASEKLNIVKRLKDKTSYSADLDPKVLYE